MNSKTTTIRFLCAIAVLLSSVSTLLAQRERLLLSNEQGRISVRDTGDYCPVPLPRNMVPPTVSRATELPEWNLSLDEAIAIALKNTDVVRVLSGVGAASSGQSIYSPAIVNTGIDRARATFDPTLSVNNSFFRNETPGAQFVDPNVRERSFITGSRSDLYDFSFNANKRFLTGADAGLRVGTDRSRFANSITPLNPSSTSDVDISLSQPLLRGRGVDVNSVPIVLAFLDTESSYFRLKGSLQNMVAGVIQGYWDLVQARTDLWVTRQQIQQSEWAADREIKSLEAGRSNIGQVAQAKASLANFKANLVASEAAVLNRVASLRGILGLPPGSDFTIVPTTQPLEERINFDWEAIVSLAEQQRPDLTELKIILEADRQRIMQARNRAQPQLDAVALYRWNGLEGEMPIGDEIAADPGQHTDWSLAVNFSVPFSMRADRAALRQNELLLASDRANLQQGLLQASHSLASVLRSIDQLYEQYDAFREARAAAEVNLNLQFEAVQGGKVNFIELLLAINTWAGSVTSESRSVTQLNSTFASLEVETGTILETHGVRLFEERYCSLGPLGRLGKGREYPSAMRPSSNQPRYEPGTGPAEEVFDLEVPVDLLRTTRLPAPEPEYR